MSLGVQAGTDLGWYLNLMVVWTLSDTGGGSFEPPVCLAMKLSWLMSVAFLLVLRCFIFMINYYEKWSGICQSRFPRTFFCPKRALVPLPLLHSGLVTGRRRVNTSLVLEGVTVLYHTGGIH